MSTFVSVGNGEQPFTRLLAEVDRLAAEGRLPLPVIVQHGSTRFASSHCECVAFFERPDFDKALGGATLLITHGGATVLQGVRAGRVPVVMPRRAVHGEVVDDHQVDFAASLEAAGKVMVAAAPEDLAGAISRALDLQIQRENTRMVSAEAPLLGMVRRILEDWSHKPACF
ncbi:MAG: glycosyltransferase [Bryobacteraceae bacterium]